MTYQMLGGEWNGSRSTERQRQSSEHHKVGVKLYALQPTHAKRREAVVVFESSELALNGYAVLVEGAEAFAVGGRCAGCGAQRFAKPS
jgi:hypothetical protein